MERLKPDAGQEDKWSRSDKLLAGSVVTAIITGSISPPIGGIAISVGLGTGAYKVGRAVFRKYFRREAAR